MNLLPYSEMPFKNWPYDSLCYTGRFSPLDALIIQQDVRVTCGFLNVFFVTWRLSVLCRHFQVQIRRFWFSKVDYWKDFGEPSAHFQKAIDSSEAVQIVISGDHPFNLNSGQDFEVGEDESIRHIVMLVEEFFALLITLIGKIAGKIAPSSCCIVVLKSRSRIRLLKEIGF
jgi:hypothetical protein